MHFLKYIRYFIFLASKFNLRVALHVIKYELKGEKKYGIDTTGVDKLRLLEKKGIDTSHAAIYMPASYDVLEEIFKKLENENLSHFLDLGCGKGRAMIVAADQGFKNITGIDISKELCDDAKKNIEKAKQYLPAFQYSVINNDAFYFDIPGDADCIFLFNPFDEVILSGVVNNIEESLNNTARNIFIIYLNPLHKHLFLEAGYQEIFYGTKLEYLDGCILKK